MRHDLPRRPWWVALVVVLALGVCGCTQPQRPHWNIAVTASDAQATGDEITLISPDAWAVAVADSPRPMAAVISTQRLVSEWDTLMGPGPVNGRFGNQDVTVTRPQVSSGSLTFPAQGDLSAPDARTLTLDYTGELRTSMDLPTGNTWTYTLTFGPGRLQATTLTAKLVSGDVVAFASGRARSIPTSEALTTLEGPAYLVLLDNRTYSMVPVTLSTASLDGDTLILRMQNSAPPAGFNRGALFVPGLPTPA